MRRAGRGPDAPGLEGQVAIVTGGAGGIGRAVCEALARCGATVVAVDRVQASVDAVAAGLAPAAPALGLAADVRDPAALDAVVRESLRRFGRIDILVAAAGLLRGAGRAPRPLAQLSVAEWDDVVGTNLRGTFLSNRAVLPVMLRQRRGQIVNVSSTSGRRGRALDAVYCASKFAVLGFSESIAREVAPFGVRVHVILPDAVRTDLWRQNGPVPCPRNALDPSRVAELVAMLLLLPWDTTLPAPVIAPFGDVRATRVVGGDTSAMEG